ncbi:acid protease [Fomes fomentarius]|nr:acid protease [Fomes fomentarius]
MRLLPSALALLLSASLSTALRIPVKQTKSPNHLSKRSGAASFHRPILATAPKSDTDDGDGDLNLSSFHDLLYIANVTVGGTEYPLQLDTGSSDLWVKGKSSPLPHTNQTAYTLNITYGIGSTSGHIAYADVEFAGITVKDQAFIDATVASNPIINYGVSGIVGLGFTKLSTIDGALQKAGINDGKSLLYNLFLENPDEPNFIAFALQRTVEHEGDVEGSFTVGEYEEEYGDVVNSPKIPTFPVADPMRWTVLLDALLMGDSSIPLSTTVEGAPSDKAVIMLDSGTSYTYAPKAVCDAIYGTIQGAQYSDTLGMWIVPCDAEVDIALQFGARYPRSSSVYPVHPLDITPANVNDDTMCVGSFIPQTVSVGAGQFDWLIGDNVMRSLYTVYDFGDFDSSGKMGSPYMQLLTLVDPNVASKEFHSIRGGTPLTNITYNAQDVSSTTGTSAVGASSVDVSSEISDTLNKLQSYIPAMLAILALNALVILLLAVAAFVYLFRRRNRARARRNPGRSTASPMPLQRTSSFGVVSNPGNDQLGTYQPVSMALTEDTFVPPTPAFSKPGFEGNMLRAPGSPLRAGDRPNSIA